MSWRVLPIVILLVLITTFISVNLKNVCDVSFGFWVVPAVPVFLTVLVSFCAGMLIALPLMLIPHSARKTGRTGVKYREADTQASASSRRSRRSEAKKEGSDSEASEF